MEINNKIDFDHIEDAAKEIDVEDIEKLLNLFLSNVIAYIL